LNKSVYLIVAAAIITSCAGSQYSGKVRETGIEDLPGLFRAGAAASGDTVVITAKVRLELPKYRVRGICNITRFPGGDVRIDFEHSSLFGSYREEAAIFISHGWIEIYDLEREQMWDNQSTLALLSERFDFEILPEDILYLLLLEAPGRDDLSGVALRESEDGWTLGGFLGDRRIEMKGKRGIGPEYFRQCSQSGRGCYIIRYGYGGEAVRNRYPEKIVCRKEYTSEKLSLTVISVEKFSENTYMEGTK
jgi:hypothetical protein